MACSQNRAQVLGVFDSVQTNHQRELRDEGDQLLLGVVGDHVQLRQNPLGLGVAGEEGRGETLDRNPEVPGLLDQFEHLGSQAALGFNDNPVNPSGVGDEELPNRVDTVDNTFLFVHEITLRSV